MQDHELHVSFYGRVAILLLSEHKHITYAFALTTGLYTHSKNWHRSTYFQHIHTPNDSLVTFKTKCFHTSNSAWRTAYQIYKRVDWGVNMGHKRAMLWINLYLMSMKRWEPVEYILMLSKFVICKQKKYHSVGNQQSCNLIMFTLGLGSIWMHFVHRP